LRARTLRWGFDSNCRQIEAGMLTEWPLCEHTSAGPAYLWDTLQL
jgi:hypothetical protein